MEDLGGSTLEREVAGRPCVGMAEAEQEIDVGRPGPDPVQGGQPRAGLLSLHRADGGEIDLAPGDGFADRLHRPYLGLRQPQPGQPPAQPLAPGPR